jgi:hypothetical protein
MRSAKQIATIEAKPMMIATVTDSIPQLDYCFYSP